MLYLEPAEPSGPESSEGKSLLDYWRLVRSRKLLVACCLLLGLGTAAVLSLLEEPLYQARATLEFQAVRDGAAMVGLKGAESFTPASETYLQTQVRVLESLSLHRRVTGRLRKEGAGGRAYAPQAINAVRSFLRLPVPTAPPGNPNVLPEVVTHIGVLENSRIVEVRCESWDPAFAARFANTLAAEYIDSSVQATWDSTRRTSNWLNQQMEEMRVRLQQSENQLQSYSRSAGLIFTPDQHTIDEDKLRQLQDELTRIRTDRMGKQSSAQIANSTPIESVPQVVDDGRLSTYQSQLAGLRRELAELTALYTPEHYKVARIQAQIKELETTLGRERGNILRRINNDYEALRRREEMLQKAYDQQLGVVTEKRAKSIYYGILKREVDTNQALYDELLHKVKQVSIGSALEGSNVRVLDSADPPRIPTKPNLPRNLAVGLASGLLLGIGLVVSREFMNRSLRVPGEVAFHLHLPELGVIPVAGVPGSSDAKARLVPANRMSLLPTAVRNSGGDGQPECVELITWQDQPSIIAESFRSALASILVSQSASAGGRRVILVTSAGRGEGKSSVVSNLGLALAEINQKVLLVDADMRKPRMHEIFNISNSWGLSNLLREKIPLKGSPLQALARPTSIENLYVLPSGPGTASIANLLYSGRLAELMGALRDEFDVILVDTPPISYVFDARVLGRVTDGAILVIRAGQTTRDAALTAKQRLIDDHITVLGTILNAWEPDSKSSYGYGYGYGYGYSAGQAQ
jgi:polysaccharide biosynthesis transport protein